MNESAPSRQQKYYKEYFVKRNYSITLDEYNNLISKGCQICGTTVGKLVLDHDHKTGIIRDCLCHNCNTALGLLNDDIKRLENCINYLRRFNGPVTENLK